MNTATKSELAARLTIARRARLAGGKHIEITDVDVLARLASIPNLHKVLFRKVFAGKAGRPARVKAKCLDCCCYQKSEVAACTARFCPLWPIRPYQVKRKRPVNDNDPG
jgi:hypothetical protein